MHDHAARTSIEQLCAGDHLCTIYETDEQHRALLTAFIGSGLRRNERVFYIVDARTSDQISAALDDAGIDSAGAVERGQLVFLTRQETYLVDGAFVPEWHRPRLQQHAGGHPGQRRHRERRAVPPSRHLTRPCPAPDVRTVAAPRSSPRDR